MKFGRVDSRIKKQSLIAYPVQESSGKLMTSWRSSRRNVVALENVYEPTLVLVQMVILSTDGAHFERVAV